MPRAGLSTKSATSKTYAQPKQNKTPDAPTVKTTSSVQFKVNNGTERDSGTVATVDEAKQRIKTTAPNIKDDDIKVTNDEKEFEKWKGEEEKK